MNNYYIKNKNRIGIISSHAQNAQNSNSQPDQALTTKSPVFTLELRSEGRHPTPVEVRLRQALKLLLRAFGLRCVSISEVKADDAREDAK